MRIINVDCYYKCDVENGTVNCFFVERGVKTGKPYTLQHTFKTLNIYDIAKTDFCSCFSSICFINKEVEEKDLADEKKKDKKMIDVDCYYVYDYSANKTLCWFVDIVTKKVTDYIFSTLSLDDISDSDFCNQFRNINFISKRLTDDDLVSFSEGDKPLDVNCYYQVEGVNIRYWFVKDNHLIKDGVGRCVRDVDCSNKNHYARCYIANSNPQFKINGYYDANTIPQFKNETNNFFELEAKIEELTKTNKELDISYNDLVAKANHYFKEKFVLKDKLKLADKKIEVLSKENQSLNEQLKVIGEKARKYQSDVVLKNDELDYVSSRYQNLKKDVEKLEKKNEELREREKKYCASHESILKDRNALRTERDKALSDLGVANTIIKRNDEALVKEAYNNVVLQNSLDKFVQSNLNLINQLTVYRSNNKMLIEMVDLNGQVGNDLRKVKQLSDDKMTLTEGINSYKNRVEKLENRVLELEMELTSKTVLGRSAADITALIEKNEDLISKNKLLTACVFEIGDCLDVYVKKTETLETENKKIKDIGVLLQTLGVNIEGGDDLVVTIEKVLGNNK